MIEPYRGRSTASCPEHIKDWQHQNLWTRNFIRRNFEGLYMILVFIKYWESVNQHGPWTSPMGKLRLSEKTGDFVQGPQLGVLLKPELLLWVCVCVSTKHFAKKIEILHYWKSCEITESRSSFWLLLYPCVNVIGCSDWLIGAYLV